MSKAAFSLRVFSIYLFALGLALVAAPNALLALFGQPQTHEVWIRIAGTLVCIIGYLDFMASSREFLPYFRWSVYARLAVPAFFAAFVLLGFAPPLLMLFGLIDAAGAVWTAICLAPHTDK